MPPERPPQPKNHQTSDPWSSASAGHQRADGPTLSHTTAWRDSRTEKLHRQFIFGDCNADYNGWGKGEWVMMDREEGRGKGKEGREITDFMGGVQKRRDGSCEIEMGGKSKCFRGDASDISTHMPVLTLTPTSACTSTSTHDANRDISVTTVHKDTDTDTATHANAATPAPASTPASITPTSKKILTGTTIYLNGSTMPLISDHKLKRLLVSNGAKLSLVFARSVTHVIIGKPNNGANKGAGGGLAAGKLQKEIERCARGVKIVGVEWAFESIKAEKRLSETKFAIRLGKQPSVLGVLR
ncbi:uncharacterized protein EURHEDRAFT_384869 [Aspergillus ruber CBS 135680]|uniref:BRCT domain-containing protein n=1 Tax=Aspergillus ruber (strain CBS 135680) TaxID=1388766 RepID=A0A017SM06_ASPRC|nr:uncharacterized protein EURHEDRAFT_384869 [Aspergillus ruber CBS 135680]EYE97330.1 hypothetical protein EURHEDRAFT_384869 [Aspergillus ruber CBS 135680]